MKKQRNDLLLIIAVTTLLTIGLIMVFSASAVVAEEKHGSLIYFAQKQIIWGFFCVLAIFVFSRVKYTNLARENYPIIFIVTAIIFLLGLFIWGDKVNGARRWYNIGIASFQPSEFAKIVLIIYFADIFTPVLRNWKKGLLPHLLIFLSISIPIFYQPDLGTVLMLSLTISTMIILSNIRFKHLLAGVIFIIPALFIKIQTSGYQSNRLTSWFDNISNPLGSGYQIKQSLIGLGSGGFWGSGPGTSKEKFFFLPDSHTDFVFSILGEEFGYIGTTLVLILFLLILWRGIYIAKRAPNTFGKFLAIGLTMNLVLYCFVNVAVVTMLIPTTGIPIPFISYGGSSLLFSGITVGILMNISRYRYHSILNSRLQQWQNNRQKLYQTFISMR
jgi:cell division protein FtsW